MMPELLKELRTNYRLYLTDGFPGVIVVFALAITVMANWGPHSGFVDSNGRLQASQLSEPILLALGAVLLILAPAIGVTCNFIGFLLLGHITVFIACRVFGWKSSADERVAWLWLQKNFPDTWEYCNRSQGVAVLARTLSLFCLVAVGVAVTGFLFGKFRLVWSPTAEPWGGLALVLFILLSCALFAVLLCVSAITTREVTEDVVTSYRAGLAAVAQPGGQVPAGQQASPGPGS